MRYLRTHLAGARSTRISSWRGNWNRAPVAIEIAHERGIYRLTLLTRDQPGLFASVAGAIASFGLNIVKAEAFSNAQGIVVDTFTFSDPHRTLELNPSRSGPAAGHRPPRGGRQQEAGAAAARPPQTLLPSRARLKPRVNLNNDASEAPR